MEAARITPRKYGGRSAEERRAERRATLLDAALGIWQEQGWAAVTMRGVCARAGLTDRYFYESFADRDELLATVWDQARDQTLAMVLSSIADIRDTPPLDQLRVALHVVVHHIAEEPHQAQIIFGDHAGSTVLEERRRDTVQLATDLLIDLARPFLRDDVDETAFRIAVLLGMGGFVEVLFAWQTGLVEIGGDEVVEQLTDLSGALGARFLRDDPTASPRS
jgi:AcrR family transcriptional regulator